MILTLYRLVILFILPIIPLYLRLRCLRGKEDNTRLKERYGISNIKRPGGKVYWFHGASVGECVATLVLVKAILEKQGDATALITSGTVTSAAIVPEKAREFGIGNSVIHQYVPLDHTKWVARFLDHWQPQLAVMIEGDLWPNTLLEIGKRNIPLALASAQMSSASAKFWRGIGRNAARRIFGFFDAVLAVDETQARRLKTLPFRPNIIKIGGSMKIAAPPLPDLPNIRKIITAAADGREIVALLSSHKGEEELFIDAMHILGHDQYFAVIAPRHPQRSKEVLELIKTDGKTCKRRSQNEWPSTHDHFWLADSMGEMGALIRAADIIVLGGGFRPLGGHNPMEMAALGKGVISGSQIFKNKTAFHLLEQSGGAIFADNTTAVADAIALLSSSPSRRKQHNNGALNTWRSLSNNNTATDALLALTKERTR